MRSLSWRGGGGGEGINIIQNLLSTRTTLPPNIPWLLPFCFPVFFNLLTRQALVVTVVPLADGLCDFHLGFGADWLFVLGLAVLFPGKTLFAADIEEFEGPLGAVTRGDVATQELAITIR